MWRGTCSSQTGRCRTHRGFMSFGQQLFHQFLTFLDVWWRLTLMDLGKSGVPPLTHRKCWSRWYLESITWSESTSTSMIEVKLSYPRYSTPQTGLMLILHFHKCCNLENISMVHELLLQTYTIESWRLEPKNWCFRWCFSFSRQGNIFFLGSSR